MKVFNATAAGVYDIRTTATQRHSHSNHDLVPRLFLSLPFIRVAKIRLYRVISNHGDPSNIYRNTTIRDTDKQKCLVSTGKEQ